jgi:two-component system OmpR family response regulator
MRVLVVEDEVALVETIREGLGTEGFTVDLAHEGVDGLWMAAEQPHGAHDVAMLDIMLPKLSGHELCRELRRRAVWTPY